MSFGWNPGVVFGIYLPYFIIRDRTLSSDALLSVV